MTPIFPVAGTVFAAFEGLGTLPSSESFRFSSGAGRRWGLTSLPPSPVSKFLRPRDDLVRSRGSRFSRRFTYQDGQVVSTLTLHVRLFRLLCGLRRFRSKVISRSRHVVTRHPNSTRVRRFYGLVFILLVQDVVNCRRVLRVARRRQRRHVRQAQLQITIGVICCLVYLRGVALSSNTTGFRDVRILTRSCFAFRRVQDRPSIKIEGESRRLIRFKNRTVGVNSSVIHRRLRHLQFSNYLTDLRVNFSRAQGLAIMRLLTLRRRSRLFNSQSRLLSTISATIFITSSRGNKFRQFLRVLFRNVRALRVLYFFCGRRSRFHRRQVSLALVRRLRHHDVYPRGRNLIRIPLF